MKRFITAIILAIALLSGWIGMWVGRLLQEREDEGQIRMMNAQYQYWKAIAERCAKANDEMYDPLPQVETVKWRRR